MRSILHLDGVKLKMFINKPLYFGCLVFFIYFMVNLYVLIMSRTRFRVNLHSIAT